MFLEDKHRARDFSESFIKGEKGTVTNQLLWAMLTNHFGSVHWIKCGTKCTDLNSPGKEKREVKAPLGPVRGLNPLGEEGAHAQS